MEPILGGNQTMQIDRNFEGFPENNSALFGFGVNSS